MIGNFRLANKFATINSRYIYENVYFDRFNSIFRGFYLVVGQQQLAEMIQNNNVITFTKIPSTERFGSQDITKLEFFDPMLITPDEKKIIHMLNVLINTGTGYAVVSEQA